MTTLSAYICYKYDFEKPSICIAMVSALLKHSWCLIIGIGALGPIYRYGWFMPNIFNYSCWRVLGRISYATFICQIFILRLLMSGIHQPMYLSVFNIVSWPTMSASMTRRKQLNHHKYSLHCRWVTCVLSMASAMLLASSWRFHWNPSLDVQTDIFEARQRWDQEWNSFERGFENLSRSIRTCRWLSNDSL